MAREIARVPDASAPATDEKGPEKRAGALANPGSDACIVHITDLHVGRQFNETVWASFLDTCESLRPDLILVTGDLVDSPYRWCLRRAQNKLYEARRRVEDARDAVYGSARKACRLLVVPGNHDTRIWGVAPLRRLFTPLICCLAIAVVAAALSCLLASLRAEILLAALAGMGLVWLAYWIPFGRFPSYFGPEEAVTVPTMIQCSEIAVQVYPFDSASFPIVLAGGHVRLDEFVRSRRPEPAGAIARPPAGRSVYRIAALHHHPLPIPYEDALEETLILRNAGALLLELAKLSVRLIIHGHKHVWHFNRTPILLKDGGSREIAVLGGSTLTRGLARADGDTFGFNVVRIEARGSARVTRYKSRGGPFDVEDEFDVEDSASTSRWLQLDATKEHGVRCRVMTDSVEINLDGDAERRQEFRGFQVVEPGRLCDRMPGGRRIGVSSGHIERVEARPLAGQGPRLIQWEPESRLLREHRGAIVFGREVGVAESPFDFFRRWHEINSYAMTAGQFRRMYPSMASPAFEFTTSMTPLFPCDEFRLSVYFPAGFEIDGDPELVVSDNQDRRIPPLEAEWRSGLYFSSLDGAISLAIVCPPPDTKISVRWRLVDRNPPAGLRVRPLQGEAKELAAWLLSVRLDDTIHVDGDTWTRLCAIVSVIEDSVRESFALPSRAAEPLEVSVAAYDPAEERLRFVLGNFPPVLPAWRARLAYGDGIAGRAYKANRARWFVKARAEQTGTPYYYFPSSGHVGGEGIEDEVLCAVPLTLRADPEELYGVLSVSSKRAASRLAYQDANEHTPAVLETLNRFCFEKLDEECRRQRLTGRTASDMMTKP